MRVTRRWGYFSGTKPCPVPADPANVTTTEAASIEEWEYQDSVASFLLSQRLPDTTAMRLANCSTTMERWALVSSDYQAKSAFAQADLHQAFLDMRCTKGVDVREFLSNLCYKKEELAAAGITITDKEYERTILKGIPNELATFASQLLSSALILNQSASINMDALTNQICEEADRLKSRRGKAQGGKKDSPTDEALAATASDDGRQRRRKGKCHNCGKLGHWAKECRSPKKDKGESAGTPTAQASTTTPKPENKPVGSANVIYDTEGDGFWMASEEAVNRTHLVGAEPDPMLGAPDDITIAPHREGEEIALGEEEWIGAVIAPIDEDSRLRVELYDSGATRHISPYRSDFSSYLPLVPPIFLNTANQQRFPAIGSGTLVVRVPNGDTETELTLHGALHAPAVGCTLVSVAALDEEGYHAHIGAGHLELTSPQGKHIGRIPRTQRRLYKVVHALDSANAVEPVSVMEMHRRLGHIAPESVRSLVDSGAVTGVELDPDSQIEDCTVCKQAKATRLPIPKIKINPTAKNFGEVIHTDVWGPAPSLTRQGRKYFVTFTDEATRYTVTFLLRAKSEAFDAYKTFEAWATTQQHCTAIKALRSDRGGEYLSEAFNKHLAKAGTARKLTTHDTPQLNGIAERLNWTLMERVRALNHSSGLPTSLWGEALRHATWLKNRSATRKLDGKTPFEALYGCPPDLSTLRIWGSPVWVHNATGSKFDARACEARWIGPDVDAKAHRIFWPRPGNVTVERNVYFGTSAQLEGEEENLPVASSEQPAAPPSPSNSNITLMPEMPTLEEADDDDAKPEAEPQQQQQQQQKPPKPPRRSGRIWQPSRIIRDLQSGKGVTLARTDSPNVSMGLAIPDPADENGDEAGGVWFVIDGSPALLEDFDGLEQTFMAETADAEGLEPRTLAEAKRRPDWLQWEKAILEELATLEAAGTWVLEEPPPGANIIGSKWVFKAKKDAAGIIARFKARLVAQGFSQIDGVDYDDTYAPVARLPASRAIIAMANRLNLELHQVDIKGAYLNGELNDNEVLYMQHPPGYRARDAGGRVLRLKKTLYGLKQSGRRWYQKLSSIFDTLNFSKCSVDQAVFYKLDKAKNEITVVAVHVDDCTIAASNLTLIEEFKAGLRQHVEVTDLGELHWMLGVEIKRDRQAGTIHLSQRAYIDSILKRYNFDDLKPLSSPMDSSIRLTSEQSPATTAEHAVMRDKPYREAVGALNWAALTTRPDIAFAVATVARFAANPGIPHWEAVKRIYRYLAGTRNLWLTYGETRRVLEGYADADGSMAEDRRAITGYAFLIDGGAVSWSSKRQEIVSLSTTESEYVAATHGMKEALWLRSLLSEVFGPIKPPTTLFSDNQAAIALTRDHQYHARTKHIDVRYHFIRWVIEQGSLRLIYCPTDDMVADALTKALPSAKVKHFAAGLGLRTK